MYSVKLNKQQHQVVFSNQNKTAAKGFFNKKPFDVNTVQLEKNKYHVLHENKSYLLEIVQQNNNKISLKVNGNFYETTIESPFDNILLSKGIHEKKEKQIKASMPGKVVKINVKKGDKVNVGDLILVLEAMKMENSIKSGSEGTVKKVLVAELDTIAKNDVLIEFE
jgi:biotin carboxyl carrier protein